MGERQQACDVGRNGMARCGGRGSKGPTNCHGVGSYTDPRTGDIYIGGAFHTAGQLSAQGAVMWDGTQFRSLAGGCGPVNCLVWGSNNVLVAGGK